VPPFASIFGFINVWVLLFCAAIKGVDVRLAPAARIESDFKNDRLFIASLMFL
jgi:hypothetical protein